jgi:hypothetical protein
MPPKSASPRKRPSREKPKDGSAPETRTRSRRASDKVGSRDKSQEELQRQLGTIVSREQAVERKKLEWQSAKEIASAAKKAYETELKELLDIIKQPMLPLFDQLPPKQNGAPVADAPAAPTEPDAWRSVKIEDLTPALKPAKLKALHENEPRLITMGDVADLQAEKGEWWWKTIKQFGESVQTQYADACENYWQQNPQHKPAEPEKQTTLTWNVRDKEGNSYADNTAGVKDGPAAAAFYVDKKEDGKFHVSGREELIGEPIQAPFENADEAQAWCQARNDSLIDIAKTTSKK